MSAAESEFAQAPKESPQLFVNCPPSRTIDAESRSAREDRSHNAQAEMATVAASEPRSESLHDQAHVESEREREISAAAAADQTQVEERDRTTETKNLSPIATLKQSTTHLVQQQQQPERENHWQPAQPDAEAKAAKRRGNKSTKLLKPFQPLRPSKAPQSISTKSNSGNNGDAQPPNPKRLPFKPLIRFVPSKQNLDQIDNAILVASQSTVAIGASAAPSPSNQPKTSSTKQSHSSDSDSIGTPPSVLHQKNQNLLCDLSLQNRPSAQGREAKKSSAKQKQLLPRTLSNKQFNSQSDSSTNSAATSAPSSSAYERLYRCLYRPVTVTHRRSLREGVLSVRRGLERQTVTLRELRSDKEIESESQPKANAYEPFTPAKSRQPDEERSSDANDEDDQSRNHKSPPHYENDEQTYVIGSFVCEFDDTLSVAERRNELLEFAGAITTKPRPGQLIGGSQHSSFVALDAQDEDESCESRAMKSIFQRAGLGSHSSDSAPDASRQASPKASASASASAIEKSVPSASASLGAAAAAAASYAAMQVRYRDASDRSGLGYRPLFIDQQVHHQHSNNSRQGNRGNRSKNNKGSAPHSFAKAAHQARERMRLNAQA